MTRAVGPRRRPPGSVALGGGHGLAASLSALRRVTDDLTAVVTVADDGGSCGRLRRELGVLPPGDLRMALAALCGDDDWGTHLERGRPAPVRRRRRAGRARGRQPADRRAVGAARRPGRGPGLGGPAARRPGPGAADGRRCRWTSSPRWTGSTRTAPDELARSAGQVASPPRRGQVRRRLGSMPADPPACPEARARAIAEADWVVLGPGLVVHQRAAAPAGARAGRGAARQPARRLVVLNLAPQPGETDGFSPEQHLEVLR